MLPIPHLHQLQLHQPFHAPIHRRRMNLLIQFGSQFAHRRRTEFDDRLIGAQQRAAEFKCAVTVATRAMNHRGIHAGDGNGLI